MAKQWALLTSDQIRHRYVANELSRTHALVAVVSEPKKRNPATRYTNETEKDFLAKYFRDRDEAEAKVLALGREWRLARGQRLITVGAGGINDPAIVEELQRLGVTHCLVFGSSWLKAPWLDAFGGKMVNLHLGLSPYLRGAGTNFWALHLGRPELFGATIHLIDEGIDTGPILFHVRPDIAPDDDAHTLGNKTIARAAQALVERLERLDEYEPVPQWHQEGAREYKMKDFDAQRLEEMLRRLEGGMLRDHVKVARQRAGSVKTIREY